MSSEPQGVTPGDGRGIPQEVGAGLFLLALAAIGIWGGFRLNFGKLSEIGPGLFPLSVSVLLGAFGIFLVFVGLTRPGEVLTRWNLRGLFWVLLSITFFALFIRGMTIEAFGVSLKLPGLGLLVCVPVIVMLSSLADPETSLLEILPFAILMTVLCGILFKDLLSLPVPFDPAGIVPDFLAQGYASFKKAIVNAFLTLIGRK